MHLGDIHGDLMNTLEELLQWTLNNFGTVTNSNVIKIFEGIYELQKEESKIFLDVSLGEKVLTSTVDVKCYSISWDSKVLVAKTRKEIIASAIILANMDRIYGRYDNDEDCFYRKAGIITGFCKNKKIPREEVDTILETLYGFKYKDYNNSNSYSNVFDTISDLDRIVAVENIYIA